MNKLELHFATPLRILHESVESVMAVFTFTVGKFKFQGATMAEATSSQASATMQVNSFATLSVEWKDSAGNTVPVDGPTSWVSSDPTKLPVEVASGNPQIANVHALGIGTVTINATADADLGSGTKPVTAKIDITVIEGEAVGGDITFSQNTGQLPPSS